MPDDNQPGVTPEQSAPVTGATNAATGSTGETPEELRARIEEMAKALKAANKEAETRRKRLDELEAAEEQRKQAAMTETEKLKLEAQKAQQRAEQAEANARRIAMDAEVRAHAAAAGFIDPTEALKLADLSKVEITEDGEVKGAREAVEALAKAKPHLVRRTAAGFGATNPGNAAGQGETDIERAHRLLG